MTNQFLIILLLLVLSLCNFKVAKALDFEHYRGIRISLRLTWTSDLKFENFAIKRENSAFLLLWILELSFDMF